MKRGNGAGRAAAVGHVSSAAGIGALQLIFLPQFCPGGDGYVCRYIWSLQFIFPCRPGMCIAAAAAFAAAAGSTAAAAAAVGFTAVAAAATLLFQHLCQQLRRGVQPHVPLIAQDELAQRAQQGRQLSGVALPPPHAAAIQPLPHLCRGRGQERTHGQA